MTNPLFYIEELTAPQPGQRWVLDAGSSQHAVRSMRLNIGEPVLISDGRGLRAEAQLSVADPRQAEVVLGAIHHQARPAAPLLNLVQALAKGDRDLLAAQMATEVGIDAVTPWQAQRSISRIRPDKRAKMLTKWRSTLITAAQQARRAYIPELHDPLESLTALPGDTLVLHEDADASVSEVIETLDAQQINIVVGPEGGISPEELEVLSEARAHAVKLGPNVMRTSTAGPMMAGLLNYLLGRWESDPLG